MPWHGACVCRGLQDPPKAQPKKKNEDGMIKSDEEGEGEEGEEEEEDLMGDQSWAKTSADDFSGAVDDMFADLLNFKGPPASPTSGPCPALRGRGPSNERRTPSLSSHQPKTHSGACAHRSI